MPAIFSVFAILRVPGSEILKDQEVLCVSCCCRCSKTPTGAFGSPQHPKHKMSAGPEYRPTLAAKATRNRQKKNDLNF